MARFSYGAVARNNAALAAVVRWHISLAAQWRQAEATPLPPQCFPFERMRVQRSCCCLVLFPYD
eukprot:2762983-Amphidinium_carterae.1